MVKEQYLGLADQIFSGTCVNITADGRPDLGLLLGLLHIPKVMLQVKLNLGLLN